MYQHRPQKIPYQKTTWWPSFGVPLNHLKPRSQSFPNLHPSNRPGSKPGGRVAIWGPWQRQSQHVVSRLALQPWPRRFVFAVQTLWAVQQKKKQLMLLTFFRSLLMVSDFWFWLYSFLVGPPTKNEQNRQKKNRPKNMSQQQ